MPSFSAPPVSPARPLGDALLILESVGKTHDGERQLFSDLTLTVHRGERLALVGPNGAGKSTLLRILAGVDSSDSGSVVRRRGVSVGYLPQDPQFAPTVTALEAVMQADSTAAAAVRAFQRAAADAEAGSGAAALNEATAVMDAVGGWELAAQAGDMLQELGIKDPSARMGGMSGGQRRRVALAGALLASPDLVVLDEPTNHLDLAAIRWLEGVLCGRDQALIMVTHDRSFMESVCTGVLELDDGAAVLHAFGGAGSYARFREAREARRRAQANAAANARVLLRKEAEWMRRQPKARATKAKARVESFYELTAAARNLPKAELALQLAGASGMARQGSKVLQLRGASYSRGDKQVLRDFWYEFEPGERLGIVGPNGAGKTTLINLITGKLEPDAGEREVGETTVVGHLTQDVQPVPEDLSLLSYLRDVADIATKATPQLPGAPERQELEAPEKVLDRVGFPRSRQHQQVSLLSGGERRRLQLAAVLQAAPNLLVLDEPTNDLDLGAVEALEELLQSYRGCLLVASHDRQLMSGMAQRLLVLQGDGIVLLFDGDYEEYMQLMQQQEAEKAAAAAAEQKAARATSGAAATTATAGSRGSSATGGKKDSSKAEAAPKKLLRLGYRERQDYEKLEGQIEKLGSDKDVLTAAIEAAANGGGYAEAAALSEKLAAVEAEIDKKTERWLELAERADIP